MPRAHIVSILFFLTNRTKRIFLDLDGLAIRLTNKKKVNKQRNKTKTKKINKNTQKYYERKMGKK